MLRLFLLFFLSFSIVRPTPNEFNEYFIKVAEEGRPCIVSIISEKTEKVRTMPNFFFFDPFEFEDPFRQEERKAQSLGSGVILDSKKGYIVTNNHVIDNAEEIKVILQDKREFKAEIVGKDPLSDVAIIKIEADSLISEIGISFPPLRILGGDPTVICKSLASSSTVFFSKSCKFIFTPKIYKII